jgi:TetR/AcrR family transcriptional regulator, transcriptional repressor of bet genes
MATRTGQADKRRRALIGAALEEISDRGTLEVTVAQIAHRAGVSSALAHHYFGGKEDLILATMRHLLSDFGAEVRAGLRQAGSSRERLSAIVRASFASNQFRRSTVSAWLTFYAKALSSKGAARLLRLYQRRLHSNLLHALRPLAGENAEGIAHVAAALIDGLYIREALNGKPTDPDAAVALIERDLDRAIAGAVEAASAKRNSGHR